MSDITKFRSNYGFSLIRVHEESIYFAGMVTMTQTVKNVLIAHLRVTSKTIEYVAVLTSNQSLPLIHACAAEHSDEYLPVRRLQPSSNYLPVDV